MALYWFWNSPRIVPDSFCSIIPGWATCPILFSSCSAEGALKGSSKTNTFDLSLFARLPSSNLQVAHLGGTWKVHLFFPLNNIYIYIYNIYIYIYYIYKNAPVSCHVGPPIGSPGLGTTGKTGLGAKDPLANSNRTCPKWVARSVSGNMGLPKTCGLLPDRLLVATPKSLKLSLGRLQPWGGFRAAFMLPGSVLLAQSPSRAFPSLFFNSQRPPLLGFPFSASAPKKEDLWVCRFPRREGTAGRPPRCWRSSKSWGPRGSATVDLWRANWVRFWFGTIGSGQTPA